MKLLQSVSILRVLTEKSKQDLQDKYHTEKSQLHKECEQLQFQMKKLEKTKNFQQESLVKSFNKEIETRLHKIQQIEFQLEQLHMLPLGSEIKEQEMQGLIDVHEGDHWSNISNERAIVIKDDTIIEIR
ncbi:YlqD family protein [Niallia sp. Krafla_26]|uniref:YlqD family protein n=1 Tax=Niallia sp. Krafla_26 TaxID=3064703 RepID=UPI003D16CEA2